MGKSSRDRGRRVFARALLVAMMAAVLSMTACRNERAQTPPGAKPLSANVAEPHWAVGRWTLDCATIADEAKAKNRLLHPMAYAVGLSMFAVVAADGRALVHDGMELRETTWTVVPDGSVSMQLRDEVSFSILRGQSPDAGRITFAKVTSDGRAADGGEAAKRVPFGPKVSWQAVTGTWAVDEEASVNKTIDNVKRFGDPPLSPELVQSISAEVRGSARRAWLFVISGSDDGQQLSLVRQRRDTGVVVGESRGVEIWNDTLLIRSPVGTSGTTGGLSVLLLVDGTLHRYEQERVMVYTKQ
jgi:hypothetical protein